MCTIGTVFDGSTVCTFKQCDLTDPTTFYVPEQRQGKAGSYLAMTRAGKPGLWAGANEQGVSFVAADNYTRTLGSNGASMPHVLSRTSTYQEENDSVDSLMMPTTLVTAPKVEESDRYLIILSRNCIPWSFIGFPTISVPASLTAEGLPGGAQLVGAPFDDGVILALASALETATGPIAP